MWSSKWIICCTLKLPVFMTCSPSPTATEGHYPCRASADLNFGWVKSCVYTTKPVTLRISNLDYNCPHVQLLSQFSSRSQLAHCDDFYMLDACLVANCLASTHPECFLTLHNVRVGGSFRRNNRPATSTRQLTYKAHE